MTFLDGSSGRSVSSKGFVFTHRNYFSLGYDVDDVTDGGSAHLRRGSRDYEDWKCVEVIRILFDHPLILSFLFS